MIINHTVDSPSTPHLTPRTRNRAAHTKKMPQCHTKNLVIHLPLKKVLNTIKDQEKDNTQKRCHNTTQKPGISSTPYLTPSRTKNRAAHTKKMPQYHTRVDTLSFILKTHAVSVWIYF